MDEIIRPPRLREGARVALVAPAGPVTASRIEGALARCRILGLEPVLGASVRARLGYLAGSDALRAADLQHAMEDPSIDAIWMLRGGYGVLRILPLLDLSPLLRLPRPVIGFSDITSLHLALRRAGLVSFHGPHPGEEVTPATDTCFRRVLMEASAPGALPLPAAGAAPRTLAGGVAEGRLAGGNLALLAASCGTPHALLARDAILVVEDVGEPVYRIDRMLTQLLLSGGLDGVAGLAFGRFTEIPESENDRPVAEVLAELADRLGVPAVLDLPVGHVRDNWTLPLGCRARLDAGAATLEVLEPAVN